MTGREKEGERSRERVRETDREGRETEGVRDSGREEKGVENYRGVTGREIERASKKDREWEGRSER